MATGRRRGGTNETMGSIEVFSMSNVSMASLTAQVDVCAFAPFATEGPVGGCATALVGPTSSPPLLPSSLISQVLSPNLRDSEGLPGACRTVFWYAKSALLLGKSCVCRCSVLVFQKALLLEPRHRKSQVKGFLLFAQLAVLIEPTDSRGWTLLG